MRQRPSLAAAALAILLALSCAPALAGGSSSPSGAATPATLENAGKQDPEAPRPDSRQPDAAGSTLTATPPAPSSPLSASSPLPSSSPLAAPDAPGSRPRARSSAVWTVSFDPAGGSSVGQQAIPDRGQASRPSPDPSKDGYLFDGWFQGNIAYDFNQPVTSSITLTARWTSEDTQHWAISPSQGPTAGNTKTTLTPPKPRGIRFSQISLGWFHSAAIGSDGNLYTWGSNGHGQLGDGTTADKHTPTQVGKPQGAADGFTWKQTSLGENHSAALGSDGQLYAWGSNSSGQLGREPSNAWPASRPGPVGFPGKPQATSICFDQTRQQGACLAAGKNLTPNPDGTWNATTPAYTPGPVPAAIDWTQDGRQQQTDTSNTYRYLSIASLPLTGGNGMLLLLATGLLAAGAAAAAKNRRQQTQTNTSHE